MGLFGSGQTGQARYSGEEHNLKLTQSVFGTTAPIIFGTRRVPGKLLFYGGFYAVSMPSGGGKGGGGGKGSQEYDYYADMQLALASGSAAGGCRGILSVWDQQGRLGNVNDGYIYTIPPGGGDVNPQVAGSASIQMDLGVTKSVAYSVVANDYGSGGSRTLSGTQSVPMAKVATAPGAGQYAFNPATSKYTFSAADAGVQVTISYSCVYSLFYFDTTQAAEVPLSGPHQISTNNQQYFWANQGVVRVDTGATLVEGTDYTQSAGYYTFDPSLAGVYVYISYTFTSSDSNVTNTSALNLTFFGGSLGQTPWSYMQSKYPGSAFGYTGLCYVGANPIALGSSATLPCYNYEVVGLNIFPGGSGLDAHFCDAFRTLLSDAFLGVGFPSANIDAWTSCYAYWAANGYLGSVVLDTQTSAADAFSAIIETGNVGAVMSGGLLKLIPYGDTTCVGNGYAYTPNTTPVATLKWTDLLPPSEKQAGESGSEDPLQVSQRAPDDCWNYVQAAWCNRLNDYNNEPINEQNDAFIASYGRRIESAQTWDWITTASAAAWALSLRLKRQCYIRNTFKFWLSWRFSYIEPMDILMLPTGETVRITQVVDSADGRLAFEAEQANYGSSNVTIYPKQPSSSFKPGLSTALPGDAVAIVVQNTLTRTSGIPYVVQIAASGRNANWGGANVYMSLDGQSYTLLDTISAPSTIGLLSAPLASGADPDLANTVSVDLTLSQNGSELDSVTQLLADKLTTLCAIVDQNGATSELIAYETAALTASRRYNLSYLRRGAYGSSVGAHTTGALFAYLGPSYKFASYQFGPSLLGNTLYLKLQSFNLLGQQMQDLSACAVWKYTLGSQGGLSGAFYRPSVYTTHYQTGPVGIVNPAQAFDGSLGTSAHFEAENPGGAGTLAGVTGYYTGFPHVVLTAPATLYVSYSNLVTGIQVGSASGLVIISVGNGIGGTVSATLVTAGIVSTPVPVNTNQGTASVTIPSGTDLSTLTFSVLVGTIGGSTSSMIDISEIWIQPANVNANLGALAVAVPYSASPTFDFSLGATQIITLTGNVTASVAANVAQAIYTIVVQQDATGGHTFTWPSNFRGAGPISAAAGTAAANTAASQTFAYNPTLGQFIAITPLTYGV